MSTHHFEKDLFEFQEGPLCDLRTGDGDYSTWPSHKQAFRNPALMLKEQNRELGAVRYTGYTVGWISLARN